uniref:THAP-type domain-containing protein n=1 Tax=Anopheles culicifacies TaxID=139723 RepID=A0A182MFN4_9DIPT
MPASCVIPDCDLKYTHNDDVSFHKSPELLKQWIQFTGRDENWHPTKWSALCSRHFVASDFKGCASRKILLATAVPSVRPSAAKIQSSDLSIPVISYETVWSEVGLTSSRPELDYAPDELDNPPSLNGTLCPVITSESVEEYESDIQLNEITCRICGVVFTRKVDSVLNDLVNSEDVVRKYLPFVNLELPNLPRKICLHCSKVVNGFSNFSDNVLRAQSDLEHRFAQQPFAPYVPANPFPTVERSTQQEMGAGKPMNIKQEPIASLNIKEEKTENAINSARQKDYVPVEEPFDRPLIIKNQAVSGDPNRIYLFNNIGQDNTGGATTSTTSQMKQHPRESSKNCEILEIVNLYPPIVDITSTTVTEVQPYEITLPSVNTAPASDTYPSLPSSSACSTQFVRSLKVENTAELDAEQDDFYLPEKFLFINTLEEHSYTKLPIQADDNKDEIFHDMAVGSGQWFVSSDIPTPQKHEPLPTRKAPCWTCRLTSKARSPKWRMALAKAKLRQTNVMGLDGESDRRTAAEAAAATEKNSCPLCDRSYANASNLRRHLASHRPPEQWNHKCGVCFRIFDKLFDLKKHLQIASCGNATNPTVAIPPSTESPETKADLPAVRDIIKPIKTPAPPSSAHHLLYVCPTCDKMFQSYSGLKVHEPIHTGTKAYICEKCGKCFSGPSHLWQHQLTHSELRQYTCKQCPKVFKRKCGLSQHVRAIHMKIKPFQCPTCGHEYALKADMTRCRHSRLNDPTVLLKNGRTLLELLPSQDAFLLHAAPFFLLLPDLVVELVRTELLFDLGLEEILCPTDTNLVHVDFRQAGQLTQPGIGNELTGPCLTVVLQYEKKPNNYKSPPHPFIVGYEIQHCVYCEACALINRKSQRVGICFACVSILLGMKNKSANRRKACVDRVMLIQQQQRRRPQQPMDVVNEP